MKTVIKNWGSEFWIANYDYCGKQLNLKKDYRCSMHYHKIKDETFYLTKGKILLETYASKEKDDYQKLIMNVGDSYRVLPGIPHRFTGLEDSEIIEFSTHHEDEDSYRLEGMLSGKIKK